MRTKYNNDKLTFYIGDVRDYQSALNSTRGVCLSTDKAVYPINAKGILKAMMEKVIVAKSRNLEHTNTTICATRYGNVMASRGSVIPLFFVKSSTASQSP